MELGNLGRGVRVVHCVGSGWGGSRMGQGGGTTGSCTWSPPSSHVTLNEGMMRISKIFDEASYRVIFFQLDLP